ncbi:hypothetical protein WDW89_13595 [Deltaproteobacteria bacterium TL4]
MKLCLSLKNALGVFLATLFFVPSAQAILFERRPQPEPELSYFLYPIAGSIPGVQDFYGAGFTLSAIKKSEVDITLISLTGAAEHFNGNFNIDILSVLDVPLFTKHITLSYFRTEIKNGAWPEGDRGINSDPDSTYYLLADYILSSGGEISFNLFDNQLEVYFGTVDATLSPYGLIDPNGTFYSAEEVGMIESPTAFRYGLYLDDTDNRREPRIGYRVQYERYEMPASRDANSAFYQEDYNLTAFIPVLDDKKGILVLNQFYGSSTVTKKGKIDRDNFTCPLDAPPSCQAILDELYNRQVAEAENGKATSLGGTQRLRGFITNRFFDSYTNFQGLEFRWYLVEVQQAFNYVVQKGVFAGFQLAAFYERGTVSPDNGNNLWKNFKDSYGIGARFIFNTLVARIDVGQSEEATETTVFIGYPF